MEAKRVFTGIPSLSLGASERKKWEFVRGPLAIDIPYGAEGITIVNKDVDTDVGMQVSLGSIVKMLLATNKYPELSDNELFAVSDILLNENRNRITVIGNVIKAM